LTSHDMHSRLDAGSRCLFCVSSKGKRSREHVLRRAFKQRFPYSDQLSFSHTYRAKVEIVKRPISQFGMTVNAVCTECNNGWLNDLEGTAGKIINEFFTATSTRRQLGPDEIELLGYWVLIRSLLRTHVSPHGRAPSSLFEFAYREKCVPPG